ncbi:hypothetical protein AVW14_09760 [Stenotrophomonas maltophilia]|nr:hypothetical protein AVW14_09760 [Stenotrophomonas maltophilia]
MPQVPTARTHGSTRSSEQRTDALNRVAGSFDELTDAFAFEVPIPEFSAHRLRAIMFNVLVWFELGEDRAARISFVDYAARRDAVVRFIAPQRPTGAPMASEHFQPGAGRAGLNKVVLLVGLTGMLPLPSLDHVDLGSPRRQRPHRATNAK